MAMLKRRRNGRKSEGVTRLPEKLVVYTCRTGRSGFYIGPWATSGAEEKSKGSRLNAVWQKVARIRPFSHPPFTPRTYFPEDPWDFWDPVERPSERAGPPGTPVRIKCGCDHNRLSVKYVPTLCTAMSVNVQALQEPSVKLVL